MARESTSEEVKKILELGWKPGETVSWAAIEEVLAPLTRQDRRFQTIYRAFIRHLRRWEGRKVVIMPGQGMRVLQERERAGDVCLTIGRSAVILTRAKTDADDIRIAELETKTDLEDAHHARVLAHRLQQAALEEMKKLAEERPHLPPSAPVGRGRPLSPAA